MLTAPDIEEVQLVTCLETVYSLSVAEIRFLPLGADMHTAVYRVTARDATRYFLKLRRGTFSDASVVIPHWLAAAGMQSLIPAITTRTTGKLWTQSGPFTVILYPFVNGLSGWETKLTQHQWVAFGSCLHILHTSAAPPELIRTIPRESYSPVWRERVTAILCQVTEHSVADPVAAEFVHFLLNQQTTIRHMIARADQLAERLYRQPPDYRLCHGDSHAGNILIDTTDQLYLVDWDTLILAPKERDLMFIGGGIGGIWNDEREAQWFYQGYGQTQIDLMAMTYYRYERIVQDIGEICEALLQADGNDEERITMLNQFTSQFEPGNVVDIADATDQQLQAKQHGSGD
jgi:spectinomycin phosphotransferase